MWTAQIIEKAEQVLARAGRIEGLAIDNSGMLQGLDTRMREIEQRAERIELMLVRLLQAHGALTYPIPRPAPTDAHAAECPHVYPLVWHAVVPPACLRCGR
jgi:hypothetical protein